MAMWPGLLCSLLTLGVPLALNYNSRRYPQEQGRLLSAALALSVVLGLIATVIGIVFIPHWLTRYGSPIVVFAQWMMLQVPFNMTTFVLQAALESRGDFTASNLSKSLPQLVSVIALVGLVTTKHITPYTSTVAYLAPWVPVPFILCWYQRKMLSLRLEHFRESAKKLISYGSRSYLIDILGTLSQQVDQVLVVGLLSASGLGLYTVALSVSRILFIFPSTLNTVLFPKASSLDPAEVLLLTGRAARISTLAALMAAIGLIVVLPFLMVHLYGGAFGAVVPVARILSIQMVIASTTSICSMAFMASGRPGLIAVLQLISLGLTVPFMLVLIPRFGLSGAALALVLSSICGLGATLACFPIVLKSKIPNLLITHHDLIFVWTRLRRRVA